MAEDGARIRSFAPAGLLRAARPAKSDGQIGDEAEYGGTVATAKSILIYGGATAISHLAPHLVTESAGKQCRRKQNAAIFFEFVGLFD